MLDTADFEPNRAGATEYKPVSKQTVAITFQVEKKKVCSGYLHEFFPWGFTNKRTKHTHTKVIINTAIEIVSQDFVVFFLSSNANVRPSVIGFIIEAQ